MAAVTIVVVVPFLGNELRVQDYDSQFARDILERVHRFGGTFYQNGIYNKGPLELSVYNVARHLGGYDGMWSWVSVFGTIAALVVAVVALRTTQWRGAPAALALAVGLVLFIHLSMSPSDYAGLLYARNITVTLLAVGWLVTFEERFWRSPRGRMLSCVVGGAVLGLVVQTLVAEVFSAAAIGTALLLLIVLRADRTARARLALAAISSAVVVFLSAPIWYMLRGSFQEYWTSWYGHAHLMSTGTGRSLGSQFRLGWDQMYGYYQHRPLLAIAISAFLVFVYLTWAGASKQDRVMNVALLGWFGGAWIEQILSQRYSSHYFVINAVPTALMLAVLVGYAGRVVFENPRAVRISIALPLVAIIGALYLSGAKDFLAAAKRTSKFESFRLTARDEENGKGGDIHAERGVLDLVSRENDPILAWTNTPWVYLDAHRVSAGRFIWKSFLMGEIYLGESGPQYVLPNTWDWFREDVRQSQPVAFVKTGEEPATGTPFSDLVRDQFQLVYSGKNAVYLRHDVAQEILTSTAKKPWPPSPGTPPGRGWEVTEGSATYRAASGDGTNALPLAEGGCVRIEGKAHTDEQAAPGFDVRFDDKKMDAAGKPVQETVHLKLEGDKASAGSDAVEWESLPSGVQAGADGSVDFSVVVGRRAAVLVVDGQVRAATTIPSSAAVSLTSSLSSLSLSDLQVGPGPSVGGC